ncbi:MAG: purine/pyrimidine permease [Bacteroidales bacterium]|nr:purine/pyrimidine permease [Bacteroidales bacterium]
MIFRYKLDDKLPSFSLMMYGLQWFLVSVPLVVILGAVISNIQGLNTAEHIFYIQKLLLIIGGGLILQILWGHKMPVVIGPASVLLIGILSASSANLSQIYTAILIGGIILGILFLSKLLPKIQFIFTPRIVIVIMALIAFTLSPVILRLIFSDTDHSLFALGFALIFVLLMTLANHFFSGIWKSTVVLLALILGTIVCFTVTGIPQMETAVGTNELSSGWFISLDFDLGTTLSFLFCYLALLINELGSVQSVGKIINADQLEKRTERAVGITGVLNVAAGSMGVIGPVDYTLSPGLIMATGCASRYPLIPAGIALLICALFPSVIMYLTLIPELTMGTILLYLMATQLSASFQMIGTEKNVITNFNESLTIGLPLMVGLFLSFAPETALNHIPATLRPILGNGFVMGVIMVLLLEHIIFRKKKNR